MDSSGIYCLTCFRVTDGENVQSTRDPDIYRIIKKHFWFGELDLEDARICAVCWDTIYVFHQFYINTEELYEQKEMLLILDEEKPVRKESNEVFLIETVNFENVACKEELDSDLGESDALQDAEEEYIDEENIEHEEHIEDDTREASDREENKNEEQGDDYSRDEEEDENEAEVADMSVDSMKHEETQDESEHENDDEEDSVDLEKEEEPEGEDPDLFIRRHVILNCEHCQAEDMTFKDLMTHLQRDHKVLKCFVACCGNRFHTRVRLVEHVQYVLDPTTFKCDQCDEVQYFVNGPALKRHLKLRHEIQFSKRPYNRVNRLNRIKTKEAKSDEQIKRMEQLENRRNNRLDEDKMIRDHLQLCCVPCGITFESYTELFRHSRIEHNQKPVVICCGNRYHNRPRLLQHIQSIVNPVAFRCELCFRCFQSDYARNKHMAEMHPTEDSIKYQCARCPKWFVREIKYKKHMQDHEDCDKDQIKCEHCGKLYKSRHILYMHIRNKHQEPRFVCDICAKPFHLQSEFKKHKLQHEDPDLLKMQCQHCLKWLKNREYWRAHIRLHVVGEVKCEICGRVTPNRVAYRSHKKNAHGARNQKCEWCGKCFNKAITLREHVASRHTGATLYKCSFCPKTFNSNANMHSHQKKMHPVEWRAARQSAAASAEPASVALLAAKIVEEEMEEIPYDS